VSDCRRELGMDIRNRQRRQTDASGKRWTTSEYQFIPAVDATPTPEPQSPNVWSLT
jgi:hypothetical protein